MSLQKEAMNNQEREMLFTIAQTSNTEDRYH